MSISTKQRLLTTLAAGSIHTTATSSYERQILKALVGEGRVVFSAARNEWSLSQTDGESSIPTSSEQPAASVQNLDVAEIAVEVVTADVPHTFKRGDVVDFLKAFPKPEEKGVWLTGSYFSLYAGNKSLACIRVNGIGEAARLGEIRPIVKPRSMFISRDQVMIGVGSMPDFIEPVVSPVYDQPALPTDDDVHEVMNREYPTVETNGGLGQHRNQGMLAATLGTLALVEQANTAASEGIDISPELPAHVIESRDRWLASVAEEAAEISTSSTFDQLSSDEPPVDEADTEPTPTVKEILTVEPDLFDGMAEMVVTVPVPAYKLPEKPRKAPRLDTLHVTPAMFKQVHRGIVIGSDRVFSRHNAWKGNAWLVGTWSAKLSLALTELGTLLILDGELAYEVSPRRWETWDELATAWLGEGWFTRGDRKAAAVGGAQ